MAVPRSHLTRARRNRRRMHIFIKKHALTKCPKCGKEVLPHTVCLNCGYYKGREVIDVLKKLTKKERKKREKEMSAKEKTGYAEGERPEEKPLNWEELSRK